jgi:hypothetical protein
MLKVREIALIALFVSAMWIVVLVLQSEASAYYQICETNKYTEHEYCTPHHHVAFWYIGYVVNANTITAVATGVIAWFTGTIWVINRNQLEHGRQVERGYVKMSHYSPGVMFGAKPSVDTHIEVKNFGNTPATVTNVVVNAWVSPNGQPLPEKAIYRPLPGPIPGAFLVSNDSFIFDSSVEILQSDWEGIRSRNRQLHVIGYVDYIDQFGQRHRGGYARKYEPSPTNNLVYVSERGYNYDRLRLPGEGDDWNGNS